MGDANNSREPGKLRGLLNGLFGKNGRSELSKEDSAVMEAYGIDTDDLKGMESIREMFSEEGGPLPETPPTPDPDERNTAESALYQLLQRTQGQSPQGQTELSFHLSLFLETGETPTSEQIGWLDGFESEARAQLEQLDKLEQDEAEAEALRAAYEAADQEPPAEAGAEAEDAETDDGEAEDAILDAAEEAFKLPSGPAAIETVWEQPARPLVRTTRDNMSAWIFVFPPSPGEQGPSISGLHAALAAAGVSYGIDDDKLEAIAVEERYLRLYEVARGIPPIDGEDGKIVDNYKREYQIELKVRDDNTIDYKDLNWLQTADIDQAICTIVPPTNPEPGRDVSGRELPGRPGKKPQVPQGSNTALNEDGSELVAKIDGAVSFTGGRFRVDPLLIIKGDVNTETGNINMVGSVLIHGDILEGFTVQATGNITVQGMIEGAQVMAGGDVQVGRGMNGNSHGVLQAKGEVRSKFLENATVTAGGRILCDTIINSEISSDSIIEVRTGRGAIIGGHITALKSIEAQSIGNQSNRNMVINMGNTANLLREKHELEEKVRVLQGEVEETEKNIRFLEVGARDDTPELGQMNDELKLKLSVLKMQLANTQRSLQAVNQKQTDNNECRLRADVIYPPVQMTIGSFSKTLRQMYYNAVVYLKDGVIEVASL